MKKSMILNVLCASMIVTSGAEGMFDGTRKDLPNYAVFAWFGAGVLSYGVVRHMTRPKDGDAAKNKLSRLISCISGVAACGLIMNPLAPLQFLGGSLFLGCIGEELADTFSTPFGARSVNQLGGNSRVNSGLMKDMFPVSSPGSLPN